MLRIVGSRIMMPKGDTGTFKIPVSSEYVNNSTIAVFSIFDELTRKTLLEKQFPIRDDGHCYIDINHNDTKNIVPGKYYWDVKIYYMPKYDEDGKLIDALQIDSLYAAHHMATFLLMEVGKNE